MELDRTALKIVADTDAFLSLSYYAQCLYFHLAVRADEDGVVMNSVGIARMINVFVPDTLIELLDAGYITQHDECISAIKVVFA